MQKKTVNINVRLTEELKRELEAAAAADDRPAGALVRRFIMSGLRNLNQRKQSKVTQSNVLQRSAA